MVLNEVMEWYKKRKKSLLVFKVDFQKAYDSLRWDFLDLVMAEMGSGNKWRRQIEGFHWNARASILINGAPADEFEISRGLRQGDPLSLFIFIIAMEGLHVVTQKAISISLFRPSSIGQVPFKIQHLMYANDITFLGEWSF